MTHLPPLRVVPADVRSPIRRSKDAQRGTTCRHHHVEVNPRERRVTCVDCGAEVDPYEALDMLAKDIERYDWARDAAKSEARQRERDLENLKRLERNAKSRVRNAIRTLPECTCEPSRRYGRFCSTCGGRVPTTRE